MYIVRYRRFNLFMQNALSHIRVHWMETRDDLIARLCRK